MQIIKYLLPLIITLLLNSNVWSLELSNDELFWLTQNIYWESRGESELGQFTVALVTINRMKSKKFPNTIKKVVTQRRQFSWYWDGKPDIPEEPKAWKKAKQTAEFVCDNYEYIDPTQKKIYWYHRDDVYPYWRNEYVRISKVGRHIFYIDG